MSMTTKEFTARKCSRCGKTSSMAEALFCPFCAAEYNAVKRRTGDWPLSPKDAMRKILTQYEREILLKDKRRFISLLKDYVCSSEGEVARIEYALTDQVIKLLYEADKKDLNGLDSKITAVKKINNRLVIYNGFDPNAALEITASLIYAFEWSISIASTVDELDKPFRDTALNLTSSPQSVEKNEFRPQLSDNDTLPFLKRLVYCFTGKWQPCVSKQKKQKDYSLPREQTRGMVFQRYYSQSNMLCYIYIGTFCTCLAACVVSVVISVFTGDLIKAVPSSMVSVISGLGIGFFKKSFDQTINDSYDAAKLCYRYETMEYFIKSMKDGQPEVVKAVIENFSKV